jgi:hypothetical protein
MDFRLKTFARTTLRLSLLAAAFMLAQFVFASNAHAQQTPPPRRPSGPAASPIIKLPRGDNASLEQTPSDSPAKEQSERVHAEPRRWEYCAITNVTWQQKGFSSSSRTAYAIVRFFPDSTEEIEGNTVDTALANAFARLGDDGWELTGISNFFTLSDGNGSSTSVYYFKRPKR